MPSGPRPALSPRTATALLLADDASFRLARLWDNNSAFRGMTRFQAFIFFLLLAGLVFFLFIAPQSVFKMGRYVLGAGFLSLAGLKLAAIFLKPKQEKHSLAPSESLPFYTVLVPLYEEVSMLPHLVHHLKKLSYPSYKLDIKLLIEEDDTETLQAARSVKLDGRFQILPIPARGPRTKPKALNYGLSFALGDLVTVYDAEDTPNPQQLREAAAAFATGGSDLGYVQAPLGFHNAGHNILTRQFALEYAFHFHVFLPFLVRLGGAFPLGGTSNHIRADVLRAAGGWDSFNVTEDADLGFRLAAMGWRGTLIAPGTYEEAVCQVLPWMGQRIRWQKGFIQSWLVQMRQPLRFIRQGRFGAFFALQFSIGADFISSLLYAPLMLAVMIAGCISLFNLGMGGSSLLHLADLVVLGIGFGVHGLAALLGAHRIGKKDLAWSLFLTPFYWFLRTGAAFCAVYEFIARPFYWHKTPHGLS